MAVERDDPYGQFNFLIALGDDDAVGGFQEVSRISSTLAVAEYRNGNEKANHVRKITGLASVADVTLRRGIIGSLSAYRWFSDVRDSGDHVRTVRVTLLDEAHSPVMTWKLLRARPIGYTAGPLNGRRANEVAMEELTLAAERLEVE